MIRAVVDTNTIVSGTLVRGGASSQVLDAAHARRFTLITSRPIMNEVTRALNRDRVRRRYHLGPHDVLAVRRFLEHDAELTALTVTVEGVATHPEDDVVLATAVSSQADYLVTWDAQLQKLGSYQGVTILSPPAFLQRLRSEDAGG